MLDTNKTAGQSTQTAQQETSEPGFDGLLIVAVAFAVAVLGAIVWNVAQNDEVTIDTGSMVSGFDYNTDATTGQAVSAGVTSQYFGHTGELFPERDLVSGFEYTDEATTFRPIAEGVTTDYFGYSGELFPEKDLVSGFDHNTDATSGKPATEGVTTDYFGNNPEFD